MTLEDIYKDFEHMLGRDLMLFELRMIRHSFICGLAEGMVRGVVTEREEIARFDVKKD